MSFQHTAEVHEEAFAWIEKNWNKLQPFTRNEDELWDVIYEKVPRLLETFDPTRGLTKSQWVWSQLSRYRSKWWARKLQLNERFKQLPLTAAGDKEFEVGVSHESFSEVEVLELIDGSMPENFAWLLKRHALHGYTHQELADFLGCSLDNIRQWLTAAYRSLRLYERVCRGDF